MRWSRGKPSRQPWPCAQADSCGPEAIASRQPVAPQRHTGSCSCTIVCPMCPALPEAPSISRPPRISPPPTPVETTIPRTFSAPTPAPRQCSATATQTASLWMCTGSLNSSDSRARSGKSRQLGMFSGETSPLGQRIGPPQPTPTPA